MRILAWLIVMLLAACSTSPTQHAPVIERLPQSTKKPSPAPAQKAPSATPAAIPGTSTEKDWRPEAYTVKKGDTLYSIGLEFGYDYKELAQRNNISPPYVIYVGQNLKLKGATTAAATSEQLGPAVTAPMKIEQAVTAKSLNEPPLKTEPKATREPYSAQAMIVQPAKQAELLAKAEAPKPIEPVKVDPAKLEPVKPEASKVEAAKSEPTLEKGTQPGASDDDAVDWGWPAQGKVLNGFNENGGAKGMDIVGTQGQPVLAAAGGKVVYSGAGLRGYGKLVIVKHNKTYLSAYAHNSQVLVKEGQEVAKGQKIAEMGNTDADQVKLHFEIRKLGKPVDPSKYLAEKP